VEVQRLNKVTEGRPHVVDMIKNGEIVLVVNTVGDSRQAIADSYSIRRSALQARVPVNTTLAGSKALCLGLAQAGAFDVYNVQELHAEISDLKH